MSELTINPYQLIDKAVSNNVDITTLEKLMDLQERWDKAQSEKAFNEAFNLFQQNKPLINYDSSASFGQNKTSYQYSSLQHIQKIVDPVLSQYGLSYYWKQHQENEKIRITCVLKHSLGHSIESWLESGSDSSGSKNTIQAIASAVSYLKRYTLLNSLGMSTGKDDDGASTSLTVEEIREAEKNKLVDLYMEKKDKLEEKVVKRLDEIIANEEYSSYKKTINYLKSL